MIELSVSLNYDEYRMLLDALQDKGASISSELKTMKQYLENCQPDMREPILRCIDYCTEDFKVCSSLQEKIEKGSRPGGFE